MSRHTITTKNNRRAVSPLDNVTVFAPAIAIGLAVDDTIHYMTQLKGEMSRSKTAITVEQCIADSYQKTARAMISTSSTLFFGFLMLALTPTKPAIYFGFLGAAATLVALLGDLVFLQSIILSFSSVRKILNREVYITTSPLRSSKKLNPFKG